MALTLAIDLDRWRAHLDRYIASRPGLIPVIKGNGYGFGRARLSAEGARLGFDEAAVGTSWELADVPHGWRAIVLTPCAGPADAAALTPGAVPTVGTARHVEVLRNAGWRGPVLVKLRTSLGRYGVAPDDLPGLLRASDDADLAVHGFGLHFPLAGTDAEHAAELTAWLPHLPPQATIHVGHLDVADVATSNRLRPRVGTALWLGDRAALRLTADVVDVRAVRRGERVGYRAADVPADGHVVLIGAGTAHGVIALDDGRSPFHHARTRLALVEPPHMHTSLCFVPTGDPCPCAGDEVDVQRPLTRILVDRIDQR